MSEPTSPPTRGFLSQSAVLIVASVVTAVLSAVYVSVTAGRLGPAAYSPVAASLSLASLLALLFGPLETGVSKFAADYHGLGDRARLATLAFGSFRRMLLPLGVAGALWLLVSPLVRQGLHIGGWSELLGLSVYSLFSFLACVPRGILRGDHRFVGYGVNQVAESALRLGTGTVAVVLGLGATGAIGGYAIGMCGAFGLALWQLRDLRPLPRVSLDVRRLYAFSAPFFFIYFFAIFTVNVDMLAAKRALSDHEAGLYGACGAITRIVYVGATPIYLVLFSRLATLRARKLPTRRLAVIVMTIVTIGLALGFLVPWFFGREVLTLAFGPLFSSGASILRIQWITTSFLILAGIGTFVLLGEEQVRGMWLLCIPCAVLSVLLWRFHGSATAVALDSLVASAVGLAIVGAQLLTSSRAATKTDDRSIPGADDSGSGR